MDKLLVLTDLHVRGIGQTILGIDALERFREGIHHATANHPDAVHIVLMGDIVHSGKVVEKTGEAFDHAIAMVKQSLPDRFNFEESEVRSQKSE